MPPKWIRDPNTQRDYYIDANGRSRWRDEGQNQGSGSGRDPRTLPGTANTQSSAAAQPQPINIPARNDSYLYSASNQPQQRGTGPQTGYTQQQPTALPLNINQQTSQNAVNALAQGMERVSIQPGYPQPQLPQSQQPQPVPHVPQPIVPRAWQERGIDYLDVMNHNNLVRTKVQTGPPSYITPPVLSKEGIPAHMSLLATDGDAERLFQSFEKRPQPKKFFTVGKVFRVLWSEPAGDSATLVSALEKGTSLGKLGELVYSKVRRFVVIRWGETFCAAIPIVTYGRRGLTKPGTTKFEHGIIHTGKTAPDPLPGEAPSSRDEKPMQPDAIRVNADIATEKLEPMSRIDYGKVYTIEHNVKVAAFGEVHPKSMNALLHQFRNVWADSGSSRTTSAGKTTAGTSSIGVQTQGPTSASQDARRSAGGRSASSVNSGNAAGSQGPTASSQERRGSQSDNEVLAQKARALAEQMIAAGYTKEQATEFARDRYQQSVAKSGGGSGQRPPQQNPQGNQQVPIQAQSQLQPQPPSYPTTQVQSQSQQPLTQSQYQIQEACVAVLFKNRYTRQQALEYIWDYVHRFMQQHNMTRDQALAALKTHLNRSQGS